MAISYLAPKTVAQWRLIPKISGLGDVAYEPSKRCYRVEGTLSFGLAIPGAFSDNFRRVPIKVIPLRCTTEMSLELRLHASPSHRTEQLLYARLCAISGRAVTGEVGFSTERSGWLTRTITRYLSVPSIQPPLEVAFQNMLLI